MNEKIMLQNNTSSKDFCYHFHRQYELIFVLSGTVLMYCDGELVHVREGCMVIIPPFTPHKSKYLNANTTRVIFCENYLSEYFSQPLADRLTARFGDELLFSKDKRSANREAIAAIEGDIKDDGGKHSYLYLYRLINNSHKVSLVGDSDHNTSVAKILRTIKSHTGEKLSLEQIASECGLSKYYICHLLRNELGISPVNYITFTKIRAAVSELEHGSSNISKISNSLSFSSPKYFTQIFKNYFGVSPSTYKKASDNLLGKSYSLDV